MMGRAAAVLAFVAALGVASWRLGDKLDDEATAGVSVSDSHPVAATLRLRGDLADLPPDQVITLAMARQEPFGHGLVGEVTGEGPAAGALLLHAAAAQKVLSGCPAVPLAVRKLCDPRARALAEYHTDTRLAELIAGPDDALAAWAADVAVDLGPRGSWLAQAASRLPGAAGGKGEALALMVRARTLPRAQAVAELEAALSGPVGVVAALELGRLREGGSALDAFARERQGTADAVLAAWASGRAEP